VGFVVDDTCRLHLRTEAGHDAHVDLSWSIDKSLSDFLRIYGTLGEIRVGWRESAWRVHGGEWEIIGAGYAKGPAMGGALDAFCLAVHGESPLAVTIDDGIAAALCIDAAYESLRRGGWVKLADMGLDDLEVGSR
jgi:predicted dehydrogenase